MVPSLGIQAAHTPCWFPSNFLAKAQQIGLLGRKEGSSLPLCCYLLFWPLPGTVAKPGLCSGYPVALFLENAIVCEGNLHDAPQLSSSATCALRTSAPEGNRLSLPPYCLDTLPGLCLVEHAGKGILVSHTHTAGKREGCCGWSALKPSSGATAMLPPQGKRGCSDPVKLKLVSRRCYYEAKPFPLCVYAAVPHFMSVLQISLELAQHEYR